jgi:cytochrome P450
VSPAARPERPPQAAAGDAFPVKPAARSAPAASGAVLADGFDLHHLDASFYDDPFPTYRALREHSPVKRLAGGGVFLTRYADVVAVYKDVRTFSSDKRVEYAPKYGVATPLYEHHTTSLVFNDPPAHTRVRRLIAGALTPRHVGAMERALVRLVDGLLDAVQTASAEGRPVDLIAAFAAAIPVEVIGNLLGVPHAEREPLRDWSLAILGALEPTLEPDQARRGHGAVTEMLTYLQGLVAHRTRCPADPETDVLTRLIQGEVAGASGMPEQLLANELLHNCIFLLNAGHETTTNLIGNALVCLARHPGERARLIADPALVDGAVEEALRIESSNQLGSRITTCATSIGGVALDAGTPVTLCIGAANRDPAQFADPDRFDIGRAPNRHLAFGSGIHQCVGMGLARLEGRVAIGRFIARFPRYRLVGAPVRAQRARFRGHLRIDCAVGG